MQCDAQFPTCSNCIKASATCTDGESLRLRDAPRNRTVSRLKRRITWLESIIRERLPDVDLTVDALPDALDVNEDEAEASATPDDRPEESTVDAASGRQAAATAQPTAAPPDHRAHEIGLISVDVNSDQRYVGPSSGYFLARMLLSASPRRNVRQERDGRELASVPQSTVNELVEAAQGPLPMPSKDHARQLCRVYFDIIHPQYPFLHQPSFLHALAGVCDNDAVDASNADPFACFQIFMVLAISSTILSHRSRRHIPGESYCLSALQYLDRLNVENSLPGLQCLLLLMIFTMHSPHMRLNVWYLNYQCIAAVLDLGLQRNVTTASGISLLDQELRTRVFWSVLTFDRTIATMMGRPIGLRDEACELRVCLLYHTTLVSLLISP